MSPILVRPVREQFEHDRVIRVLQARYKRKYEVAINPGAEQNASVSVGDLAMYPDLVLFSLERGRKVLGTVEVETIESINTLEAQAEWGPFSRLRAPFFLYVPASAIDTVRRLCAEHAITPAEIWTYHAGIDQVRFTMVDRAPEAAEPRVKADPRARAEKSESRSRAEKPKAEKTRAERPAEAAAPARPARTSRKTAASKAPRAAAARNAPPSKKAGAKRPTAKTAARPAAKRAKRR